MAKQPPEIKPFAFLEKDAQAVADLLRRAGWTRAMVFSRCQAVRAWASAIANAFMAAEEANRGDE